MKLFSKLYEGQVFAFKGREFIKVTQESDLYNAVERFDSSTSVKFDNNVEVLTFSESCEFRLHYVKNERPYCIGFSDKEHFIKYLRTVNVKLLKFSSYNKSGKIPVSRIPDLIYWAEQS